MSFDVNKRASYIQIGWGYNVSTKTLTGSVLTLPAPISVPASNEFLVEASRAADGHLIAQQVGRTQYTTELKWAKMANRDFWKINRYFEDYGYFFYMRYFSHTDGRIKVGRFYRGNMGKVNPSTEQEEVTLDGEPVSAPKFYKDVSFSIIDMGESQVTIEGEVTVV